MEKVIKGLREISDYFFNMYRLSTESYETAKAKDRCDAIEDALALLKEQEAKPMTEYDDGWDCPRCGLKLVGKTASGYPCNEFDLPNDEIVKYCPECGQAVKWDG